VDRSLVAAAPVPYWLDSPERPTPRPALKTAVSCDLAVVGGGFSGLWTALLAKETDPDREVVLVEGGRLGWAASGRNGGFCEASLTHGEANGRAHFPDEYETLERLGKTVPILSIDPFDRFQPGPLNPQGNYSAYLSNVVQNGFGHVCMALSAFSFDAATVVSNTAGVLVLDGDHHYSSVSRDLSLYLPKIAVGGFLFIDDYGPYYPDVVRAVDEVFSNNSEFKIHAKSYFVIAERVRKPGKAPREGRRVLSSRHLKK